MIPNPNPNPNSNPNPNPNPNSNLNPNPNPNSNSNSNPNPNPKIIENEIGNRQFWGTCYLEMGRSGRKTDWKFVLSFLMKFPKSILLGGFGSPFLLLAILGYTFLENSTWSCAPIIMKFENWPRRGNTFSRGRRWKKLQVSISYRFWVRVTLVLARMSLLRMRISPPILNRFSSSGVRWKEHDVSFATCLSLLETIEKRLRYERNLRPTRFTKQTLSNRSENAAIHFRALSKHSLKRRCSQLSKTGLLLKIGWETTKILAVKVCILHFFKVLFYRS